MCILCAIYSFLGYIWATFACIFGPNFSQTKCFILFGPNFSVSNYSASNFSPTKFSADKVSKTKVAGNILLTGFSLYLKYLHVWAVPYR